MGNQFVNYFVFVICYRKYPTIISPVYSVAPFDGKNITYATPHVEITIQHDSEVSRLI